MTERYTYEAAKAQALEAVEGALGEPGGLAPSVPPPGVDADLAIPCFPLASRLRKSPEEIAAALAGAVRLGPLLTSVRADGGYLNFTYARAAFASSVMQEVFRLKNRYGSSDAGAGRVVVIDYSAPNVARPMSEIGRAHV